jgi:hypothetical protein
VVISTEQSFESNFTGEVLGNSLEKVSIDASVVLAQPTNKSAALPTTNFLNTSKGYRLNLDLLPVLQRIKAQCSVAVIIFAWLPIQTAHRIFQQLKRSMACQCLTGMTK